MSLQGDLHKLLGMKQPIGTLDKLVEQVKKLYEDRVKEIRERCIAGGDKLEQLVMKLIVDITVGTGMRTALACMVVTRMWYLDTNIPLSTRAKDVV